MEQDMKSTNIAIRSVIAGSILSLAASGAWCAGGNDPVRASIQASGSASLAISTTVAAVPLLALYAGSTLTVASIEVVGSGARLLLRGAAAGAEAVVDVSAESLRTIGLAAGQTLSVVASGAGYLLVASGKVVAFVPAATDAALLHSSRAAL